MSFNVPSVDQSDRLVPINLRQSGRTPVEMLIYTRIRKSPYWALSHEAGCWLASVYNRVYHPRGYVRPEDGGAMVEYDALVNHVTMWNVAVERQIQVKGPEAAAFVNFVITRDATKIPPMRARYVILCNEAGGILNDPVLLRIAENEYWFSLSDSDLMLWLQGVNVGKGFDVEINEIDVAPVQIQGPKSLDLMIDLVGQEVADLPSYGLLAATVGGCDVIVSQTGFTGEKGYEIYLRDASLHAETMWRGSRSRQGPPACRDRTGTPPQDRSRDPLLGPGHGQRDTAVPGEPRLPGPTHQGVALHRQEEPGSRPRGSRIRKTAVHPYPRRHATRRQADRRLRPRLLADRRQRRRGSRRLRHVALVLARAGDQHRHGSRSGCVERARYRVVGTSPGRVRRHTRRTRPGRGRRNAVSSFGQPQPARDSQDEGTRRRGVTPFSGLPDSGPRLGL